MPGDFFLKIDSGHPLQKNSTGWFCPLPRVDWEDSQLSLEEGAGILSSAL